MCFYYCVAAQDDDALLKLACRLRAGVSIRDRTYHLRIYRNVFLGTEATTWIGLQTGKTRTEAVAIGQMLLEAEYIHHVVSGGRAGGSRGWRLT